MSTEAGKVDLFNPELIERVRAETAVDHFVDLALSRGGVIVTPQDAANCRAEAAEDVAILLGCPDEAARSIVSYVECEKILSQTAYGEA